MPALPRALVCAAVLACVPACGAPAVNSESEPARVWSVDPRALANSYRDRSQRWTGQTVRVELPAGSYAAVGSELHWHAGHPAEPPALVFALPWAPPECPGGVEVVAVCLGAVTDGRVRASGVRFHVRLRAQSVRPTR